MIRKMIVWFAVCMVVCVFVGRASAEDSVSDSHVMFDGVKWVFYSEEPEAKAGDTWEIGEGELVCRETEFGRDLIRVPVLCCKGTPLGYIRTEKKYKDFKLCLQWRRPTGVRADGTKSLGKGGILVRMTGEDRVWPRSLEAQLNHGGEGDFWGLDGYSFSGPEARLTKLEHEKFGKLTNLVPEKRPELELAEEVPVFHGYEVIAEGPTVTIKIDGKVVNRVERCDEVPGYICLTSEGDPIEFSEIVITDMNVSKGKNED